MSINIYYYTTDFMMKKIIYIIKNDFSCIDLNKLENTHKLVWSGEKDNKFDLNSYFELFNSEKNPLSSIEKQKYIRDNKLHTSMSVGDIININNEYWICCGIGWKKLD
jgi:hypothetical protein